ncbi:MAG: alpha/beta hydrolase [Gaiellaceae bacterium]
MLVAALAATATARAGRTDDTAYRSVALGGDLHYEVYLPSGYDTSAERYPVVYFLHGLPSGADAYRSVGFVERALDATGRAAILVIPQGARPGETDPEYVDRGANDDWGTAIALELPRVVDARYRTIRSRAGRALVGVSAGGYGAMHLALKHLDRFSVVESWSGYFHPTDPTGTVALDLGASRNVHRQLLAVAPQLRRSPTFIAFYVGRSDARFAAENEQFNHELSAAGIAHVFRLYAGGHSQALWQSYAPAWLSLALGHLSPAR